MIIFKIESVPHVDVFLGGVIKHVAHWDQAMDIGVCSFVFFYFGVIDAEASAFVEEIASKEGVKRKSELFWERGF